MPAVFAALLSRSASCFEVSMEKAIHRTQPYVYAQIGPSFALGGDRLRLYSSRMSTDKVYVAEVHARLEALAASKKMSVRGVCLKAKLAADTVRKAVERGSLPSVLNLKKISDALGVSLGQVLGYDVPAFPTEEELAAALEPLLGPRGVAVEAIPAIARSLLGSVEAGLALEDGERSPGAFRSASHALVKQSQTLSG